MAITIIKKDPERTWVVCGKCGAGRDARRGGSCKCGNVRSTVLEDGAVMTVADDSDEVGYDNTK